MNLNYLKNGLILHRSFVIFKLFRINIFHLNIEQSNKDQDILPFKYQNLNSCTLDYNLIEKQPKQQWERERLRRYSSVSFWVVELVTTMKRKGKGEEHCGSSRKQRQRFRDTEKKNYQAWFWKKKLRHD